MNWDSYFLKLCNTVALKSPCLSFQTGAILVIDKNIIATGYNGPARGIPHCNGFTSELHSIPTCPRKVLGYKSGEGMELCPAQHAEENCISNAARKGVITLGATLYLNRQLPCRNCYSTLINAGIVEIVCTELSKYDKSSEFIIKNSTIKNRIYNLQE
jgi:dCMP deaminase